MTDQYAPLAGIKVVDLSGGVAGPAAAMTLAQYGADVVKVESPYRGGDWARVLGRRFGDHSAYSLYGTLGKRCIALDLKTEEGKAVLWRLVEEADVFIEGYKPGVIKQMGFDDEAVRARRPDIVYYSISGFGQSGPLSQQPAMDPVLQAYIGITDENRGEYDNHPRRITISLIDMYSSLLAFASIVTALFARRDTGKGQSINMSLMQGGAHLSAIRMIASYLENGVPQAMTPNPNGIYKLSDCQANITMVQPTDWAVFCKVIERPEWAEDIRFRETPDRRANMKELQKLVADELSTRTFAWVSERLTSGGIMHTKFNTYSEFLHDEHVEQSGLISWLDQPGLSQKVPMPNFPGLPPFVSGEPRAHAPIVGEHTRDILRELQYSAKEIEHLIAQKIVTAAKRQA